MSDTQSTGPAEHAPGGNEKSDRGIRLPAKVVVSLRAGAVLAVTNILCVVIFSWAWMHVRAEPKSISVTGSARRVIDSDLIVWTCDILASDPNLQNCYGILAGSNAKVLAFLQAQGVADSETSIGSISIRPIYVHDKDGHETADVAKYELSQEVTITSGRVDVVEKTARKITDLIRDGVYLQSRPPQFIYTKLADLKIVMLADATKDATTRAQQIATNSGGRIGAILDARMGVMQINAIHDYDASGSGNNDTSSRQKEITAVVSARFSLQ